MRTIPPPEYDPKRGVVYPTGYRSLQPQYPARLSRFLMVVLVGVYLGQMLRPEWIELYGTFADRILAGEYYRIVTGGFLHGGILHLAMNGYFAWFLGARLESFIGPWRLALVTAVSLVTSAAAIVLVDQHAVGFSGVIYGWLAAWLGFHLTPGFPGLRLSGPQRMAFLQMLGANLLISFLPGISLAAHLGGFVGGFGVAYLLGRFRR